MLPLDPPEIDLWTRPQPRLPRLKKWLVDEVWTVGRFHQSSSPAEYLKEGEKQVNEVESLLTAAADSYFVELEAERDSSVPVAEFFRQNQDAGAIFLDGCSLRELPRFIELAQASRRPVIECACGSSAIPSTTERFIGERLGLGLPCLGPSQLKGRRELERWGGHFYFFQSPSESQQIADEAGPILVWHRFPDLRFMDSTASNAEFYDGIWDTLELIWQRTVQAIPPHRPVLVTSDHGYIFLGPGLSDQNLDRKDRPLQGKRFAEFSPGEPMPQEEPGLYVDRGRRIAAVKGRYHNRPQGPQSSHSLYRHGGMSLMEMLTPWLLLGPME